MQFNLLFAKNVTISSSLNILLQEKENLDCLHFVTAAILDENNAELNSPAKKHMFSIFVIFCQKSPKTIANLLKYDRIVL